jgi:hypothetical protein
MLRACRMTGTTTFSTVIYMSMLDLRTHGSRKERAHYGTWQGSTGKVGVTAMPRSADSTRLPKLE